MIIKMIKYIINILVPIIVYKVKKIMNLIAYGSDFKIGIWDFDTAKVLSIIEIIK